MKYLFIVFLLSQPTFAQESLVKIEADLGNWPMIKTTRMDLIEKAPLKDYKYFLTIGLRYKISKKKPILDSTMMAVFDKTRIDIFQRNQEDWKGIYVGTETAYQMESNFFYLKNKIHVRQTKKNLKQYLSSKYPKIDFCCLLLKKDINWKRYTSHIYPDERFMFFRNNLIAINSLKASGEDLSEVRKIYHISSFKSALNANYFKQDALVNGFHFEKTITESNHYFVYIWQEKILKLEEINESTNKLFSMSRRNNGKYTGWRTIEKN